ncbi:TOMM precursor leader peptide-binding protein [Streptomyces sp. NPDC057694]|uniref:TOMM precursor leader peptide-binding protein n=1 Tax=Streptomyces sp. NPDC057694 TaxID=3346216 RepID=UPI00369ED860
MEERSIRFRSDIDVRPVRHDGVFLLRGARTTVLHGPMIWALTPLLDGRYTREQVVRHLAPAFTADHVHSQLDRLAAAGIVVEPPAADGLNSPADAAYWEHAGVDADRAGERLRAVTVRLRALGGADAAPLATALTDTGLRLAAPATEDGVSDAVGDVVEAVVTDDLRDPELLAVSDTARTAHRPLWVVKLSGALGVVSPVLCAERAPCWHCASKRLSGRHLEREYLEARTDEHVPSDVPLGGPMVTGLVARLAALRIARWAARADEADEDALTFDAVTLTTRRHRMARRPQCPSCGDAEDGRERPPSPLVLADGPGPPAGTGGRALSPEALLSAYGHLVSPVTGIATELTPLATGSSTHHVYTAVHNFSLHAPTTRKRYTALRSASAGKGRTAHQAQAGALGEAIERYSGLWQGDEYRVRATLRELDGEAVHPDRLQLFSERQYRHREEWNAGGVPFRRVPVRFDDTEEHDWTPVWSLTARRHVHVPTALLYYRYPHRPGRTFCYTDSNGSAAGGTLTEAVREGLLELIERDSVALWWYNRVARPAAAVHGVAAAALAAWQEDHARTGREAWVLDITSDLGVPAAVAVSRKAVTHDGGERIVLGFGAALDMATAVHKAMREADQLRPGADAFRPGADGGPRSGVDHQPLHDWWLTAGLDNQPYLRPSASARPSPAPHPFVSEAQGTLADVEALCRAVSDGGMQVLVADLTRPDIGLPVAKVLVPGLRHFWPRYALGRLFDVPVRLGWTDAPTAEDELNPITLFL